MSEQSLVAPRVVNANRTMIGLIGLAIGMLVLFRLGVQSESASDIVWLLKIVGLQSALYLGVLWLSLHKSDSRSLLMVGLIFAVLFRLSILFSPPYLSDDIYRYIWDGRVQAAGINPYRYIPADESLSSLRDEDIYPRINRRDYAHTMYPPVAEGAYLLTTRISESVTWMKATMIAFEAVAVWAIIQLLASFGLARQRVLIYAWHPLPVWEFAGSGHVDAIVIAFVALALLARRRDAEGTTGIMLACAALVKFFPVVLFPALFRRWSWKMPIAFIATVIIAYLPYLSVGPFQMLGFLPGYAGERGIVSGEQFLLLSVVRQLSGAHVPTGAYLIFVLLSLAILAVWLIRRQDRDVSYVRSGLMLSSAFMLLLSPHFSWYFCWLIPFLCFIPSISIIYVTLASFLLYLTWVNDAPNQVLILKALIFVPPLILLLMLSRLRAKTGVGLTS